MRAAVITRPGGPEVLKIQERPCPGVTRGYIKVRVKATAVNRLDLMQRMGKYPAPADAPQDVPGVEFAGIVDEIGQGVDDLSAGSRVFGLASGGTYAEFVVVPARTVARIPQTMSFEEAAAVPESFVTAYDAMVTRGRLSAGETVLISAVASGVGLAAVQIARAIGATAIGSSRTVEKLEKARKAGLVHAIDTARGFSAEQVEAVIGKDNVDVALELAGGNYLVEDLRLLSTKGRIVLVGLLAGRQAEVDLGLVLAKRAEIHGTVLRSRPLEEKIAVNQTFIRHLLPLFEAGALNPVIDRTFDLAEVADAHEYVANNRNCGKVVLTVS